MIQDTSYISLSPRLASLKSDIATGKEEIATMKVGSELSVMYRRKLWQRRSCSGNKKNRRCGSARQIFTCFEGQVGLDDVQGGPGNLRAFGSDFPESQDQRVLQEALLVLKQFYGEIPETWQSETFFATLRPEETAMATLQNLKAQRNIEKHLKLPKKRRAASGSTVVSLLQVSVENFADLEEVKPFKTALSVQDVDTDI